MTIAQQNSQIQLAFPPVPELPSMAACVQCGRCSSVCPKARLPERSPRRVIRLLQLGMNEQAARDQFLNLCKYCGDCMAVCPQGVPITHAFYALRYRLFFGVL